MPDWKVAAIIMLVAVGIAFMIWVYSIVPLAWRPSGRVAKYLTIGIVALAAIYVLWSYPYDSPVFWVVAVLLAAAALRCIVVRLPAIHAPAIAGRMPTMPHVSGNWTRVLLFVGVAGGLLIFMTQASPQNPLWPSNWPREYQSAIVLGLSAVVLFWFHWYKISVGAALLALLVLGNFSSSYTGGRVAKHTTCNGTVRQLPEGRTGAEINPNAACYVYWKVEVGEYEFAGPTGHFRLGPADIGDREVGIIRAKGVTPDARGRYILCENVKTTWQKNWSCT